ncbi:MAG: DUF2238 domain-containing protein [Cytophagales bacterium]|nr:DUF2238 domain-containing protein [Cytophagales bacterium]
MCVWLWTLTDVADMTNWTMENYPVLLSVGFLVLTYRRLRLSDLSYALVFAFLALHIYGAKHIYAHNPLGEWLKQVTHSPRNNYDRIVHFSFGFLLAYPMRDLFMNGFGWSSRFALWSTVVVALAFGALYEIIEWLTVVLFFPQHGSNFLGLQGDEWDPQKDMLLAALGAACFAVLFALVRITAPARFSAHGNTKARQGDSQRFGQKLPETPV